MNEWTYSERERPSEPLPDAARPTNVAVFRVTDSPRATASGFVSPTA